MNECYGKRYENWDKCELCEEIIQCSLMTIELIFPKAQVIPP